jgi:hypothetical protein
MTQTFLMAPSGRPSRAKPLDPYLATDFEEFLDLFLTAKNRPPTGPEMLTFYEGHQDQYQDKFNEPFSAVDARRKKHIPAKTKGA